MRVLRILLALLLASSPIQAQPVVDLLARYSIPTDDAGASAPEGDAPPGSGKRLASLESDLALVSESLEGFSHPQDADKALLAAKPRLPEGAAPFFKDRATALSALYRTLAVVDYTWALRFPNPPCAPAAKRTALLSSDDGLFRDSLSGKTSAWMTALLGPNAKGKDLESALNQASASTAPSQAEYARLRARQNLITIALAAADAVGEARAVLYCKRAETRVKLAAANQVQGTVLASRSCEENVSREGVVIIAGKTSEGLEVRGAGIVVYTKSGIRVLTDRRLGTDEVVALIDGRTAPVSLNIEREDEKSGLLLLSPARDLGATLILAEAAPKKDDLVFSLAHSDRLGAWTKTQGLVTSSGPDQFQTDAVADASMAGGAVLDEEGRVAGLLVLRHAEGSTIDWPVAVPAPALRAWIDGGEAPATSPIDLTDRGTTKILTASRPLLQSVAVGAGAITAGYGFDTQTQWGSVHATCVANCSDAAPRSSYSDRGSADRDDALARLVIFGGGALIFKGIPALFRGIGSLFKSKPRTAAPKIAKIKQVPALIHEVKEAPPKLPDPVLTLAVTTKVTDEAVIFSARITANREDLKLDGITVDFSVNKTTAASAVTDAAGRASLTVYTPRSMAAHKSLDEESAKHPWLMTASRSTTKQNACILTLYGVAIAVGTIVAIRNPTIVLAGAAGAAFTAASPRTVKACVAGAGVTTAAAAAACKAMFDEETAKGAAPAAVPVSPHVLPPPRATAETIPLVRDGNDLVRANADAADAELENQLEEETQRTAEDEATKQDEYLAYKKRCGEASPPDLDLCARLLWELQREKDCARMREAWDLKWKGDHKGEIESRKRAAINITKQLNRNDCL